MASSLRSMVISCAAPDDDPFAPCTGVCVLPSSGAGTDNTDVCRTGEVAFWGEMAEGQMHGFGRMESESFTYVGFWERGVYHGPGLLLDHEEKARAEGMFVAGVLEDGASTSFLVDKMGRRDAMGNLCGRGLKVLRDGSQTGEQHEQEGPSQWCRVMQGEFRGDLLEGRGSVWLCHARKGALNVASSVNTEGTPEALVSTGVSVAPTAVMPSYECKSTCSPAPIPLSCSSPKNNSKISSHEATDCGHAPVSGLGEQYETDLRLEAHFEKGIPVFGRAYFSDGRAYIGRLERRERRQGIGLTVTRTGKAVLARRELDQQIGPSVVFDFAARTYRHTDVPTGGAGGEEPTVKMPSGEAGDGQGACNLPSLWSREGVLSLLEEGMHDAARAWKSLKAFSEALRDEQVRLLNEHPPKVRVDPYMTKLTIEEAAGTPAPVLASLYRGEKDQAGRRHGEGVGMMLSSGDIFKGAWVNDEPEGKGVWLSLSHRDVFEGEIGRGGEVWKAGRWCLLHGWRVEAKTFLQPRIPHGFVKVHAPMPYATTEQHWRQDQPQRTVIEAFYRVRGVGEGAIAKRDDMDVRITSGPEKGRRIFRGRVYPSLATSSLFEVPRPRNGLEHRQVEHGSMYELVYDEDGQMIENRIAILRQADGGTKFGGEFMDIMSNAPLDYHKNHVKQQSVRAEKEWPGKLLEPFGMHYTGAVGAAHATGGANGVVTGKEPVDDFQSKVQQPAESLPAGSASEANDASAGKMHTPPSHTAASNISSTFLSTPKAIVEPPPLLPNKEKQKEQRQPPKLHKVPIQDSKDQTQAALGRADPAQKTRLTQFLPKLVRHTTKANERIAAAQQEASSRAVAREQRLQQQRIQQQAQARQQNQHQQATKQVSHTDEQCWQKSSISTFPSTTLLKEMHVSDCKEGPSEKGKGNDKNNYRRVEKRGDKIEKGQLGHLGNFPLTEGLLDGAIPRIELRGKHTEIPSRQKQKCVAVQNPLSVAPSSCDFPPLGKSLWPSLGVLGADTSQATAVSGDEEKQQQQQQCQNEMTWNQIVIASTGGNANPVHKKNMQDNGGRPPPGLPPGEVLCIVEAGWQAAHVRILFRNDNPEVKAVKYRVSVQRTERAFSGSKDHKTVESARAEIPIAGLQNHVKYSFAPSIRLQFRQYTWQVQGSVVRTSPPGPVKERPKDIRQPFLRRMNGKGELLPNDDDGYWQWARYVLGHELTPKLPALKAYALKAHVHEGDGILGLQLDVAKELFPHAESLLMWAHPATEPGLVSSGKHVTQRFAEGQPLQATVSGLQNGSKYHVAFRLVMIDATYPSESGIIILPGTPHVDDQKGEKGEADKSKKDQQSTLSSNQPRSSSMSSVSQSSSFETIENDKFREERPIFKTGPMMTTVGSCAGGITRPEPQATGRNRVKQSEDRELEDPCHNPASSSLPSLESPSCTGISTCQPPPPPPRFAGE